MQKKYLLCLCLCLSACVNSGFYSVKGKTTEQIHNQKGKPVAILKEQGNEMWTYRTENCTQIFFFDTLKKVVDYQEMGICQSDE